MLTLPSRYVEILGLYLGAVDAFRWRLWVGSYVGGPASTNSRSVGHMYDSSVEWVADSITNLRNPRVANERITRLVWMHLGYVLCL